MVDQESWNLSDWKKASRRRAAEDFNDSADSQTEDTIPYEAQYIFNIYLVNWHNHSGPSRKKRPAMMSGIWTNSVGKIVGAEFAYMTTQSKNKSLTSIGQSNLEITAGPTATRNYEKGWMQFNELVRFRQPGRGFDRKKIKEFTAKLSSKHVPDYILRRASSLITAGNKDDSMLSNINGLTRTGITFTTIPSSKINKFRGQRSKINLLDFTSVAEEFGVKSINYVPDSFSQEMIDAIMETAIDYLEYCFENNKKIEWPKPGTFPNWPEEIMQFWPLDLEKPKYDLGGHTPGTYRHKVMSSASPNALSIKLN